MTDCIFCRIIEKEIPATIVYEDSRVIAFRDLYPVAPTHVLIVPKHHTENILDLIGSELADDDMRAIMAAVEKVAVLEGVNETGFRLIVNTGVDGGQTIGHTHVHLIGGKAIGEGLIEHDKTDDLPENHPYSTSKGTKEKPDPPIRLPL